MLLLSFLAEVEVWKEVTMERKKSVWVFICVEPVDSHDIPIVFYVRVTEWDLRMKEPRKKKF